ncbi:helix-turn-helix domain-containing protein [Escherichia coli]
MADQWQCGTHRAGEQAGLPNLTTHRLLTTMQQQGFVR